MRLSRERGLGPRGGFRFQGEGHLDGIEEAARVGRLLHGQRCASLEALDGELGSFMAVIMIIGASLKAGSARICRHTSYPSMVGIITSKLSVTKDGPTLRLVDENSKLRVGLSVYKNGPGLGLYDETGKTIWSQP